jgi:hypothetical protein
MSEQIDINVIAYVEKPGRWAEPIATFANEELYAMCAPVIERYIVDKHNGGYVGGDFVLTESCELDISVEVET